MAEEKKKASQNPADADDNDIVSLSDDELDNILDTAEISDTPIADIEINLDEEPPVAAASTGEKEAGEEEGFFAEEGDETISLSSNELDNILDDAGKKVPAAAEGKAESGRDDTLDIEEDALVIEEEAAPAPGEAVAAPDDDDDLPLIDDLEGESLVLDTDSGLVIEEVSDEPPLLEDADQSLSQEQQAAAAPAPESDDMVAVSGGEIDDMVAGDESGQAGEAVLDGFSLADSVSEVGDLEDSILAERSEGPPPPKEAVSKTDNQAPAPSVAEPSFELEEREGGQEIEVVEESVGEELAVGVEMDQADEEGILIEEDIEIEEIPITEEEEPAPAAAAEAPPASEASEVEVVVEEPDSGEIVVEEFSPVESASQEAADEPEFEEVSIITDEGEDSVQPGMAEFEPVEPLPDEMAAPEVEIEEIEPEDEIVIDIEEEPAIVAVESPSEEPAAVPVVDEQDIAEEPLEIMDEEVIFEEEDTIPARAPEVPPAAEPEMAAAAPAVADEGGELISDEDISEMRQEIVSQPETIPDLAPEPETVETVAVSQGIEESIQGLPERMRQDVKQVLGYLDNLFDDLPEDKVKEFANSQYYDIYNRLFKELGL